MGSESIAHEAEPGRMGYWLKGGRNNIVLVQSN